MNKDQINQDQKIKQHLCLQLTENSFKIFNKTSILSFNVVNVKILYAHL